MKTIKNKIEEIEKEIKELEKVKVPFVYNEIDEVRRFAHNKKGKPTGKLGIEGYTQHSVQTKVIKKTDELVNKRIQLRAYQEAQKLMDETLKNIIDEIDERVEKHKDFIERNKGHCQKCIKFCEEKEEIIEELKEIKQIIQKQFNSQGEVTKGIASHKNEIETPSKFSHSTKPDTSILNDFCEELKEEIMKGSPRDKLSRGDFFDIVFKLREKHGGKG